MDNYSKAQKAISDLKEAVEKKDKKAIIKIYDYIELDQSFTWEIMPHNVFEDWDILVDKANEIIYN